MASETSGGPGGPPSMADLPHDNFGPNIDAATWTTWGIACILVLLRFYTRARIVNALGWADWFIALSLVAAGGMSIAQSKEIKYGKGRHVWDVEMADFPRMFEAWWFSLLGYVMSLAFTKVSICLLYLTIFTFEWARRACLAVLFIIVVTNLWAVATVLTYCVPLQATWDPSVIATFCQSQDAWWANTGLIIITDLIIFILPIPLILPLKLPRRQKLVVVGIFAVGFFVCLVSLIRLGILIQAKDSTNPDFTFANIDLAYWTALEVHTAIVVACIMTLKPLVSRFFPRLLARRSAGGSSEPEPSAESSRGVPLTIGSKPSRQLPPGGRGQRGGGEGEGEGGLARERDGGEDVILGDLEQGGGRRLHGHYGKGHGAEVTVERKGEGRMMMMEGSTVSSEGSTIKNGEVEVVYGGLSSPWGVRGETVSTEDLGRLATARSMG